MQPFMPLAANENAEPGPSPTQELATGCRFSMQSAASRPKQLFGKPGGFEGLVSRPVLAAPRDLPVAECVEGGVSQIGLDAAELGASADPEDRDDLVVSCVDLLDGLLPEVIERVAPVLGVVAQSVLTKD